MPKFTLTDLEVFQNNQQLRKSYQEMVDRTLMTYRIIEHDPFVNLNRWKYYIMFYLIL